MPAGEGDTLDLYLDGLLSGDALRAFEARILADPALQRAVVAQRAIDQRLRSEFAVSSANEMAPTQAAAALPFQSGPSSMSRLPMLRIAAVLALLVCGAIAYTMSRPMSPLVSTYRATVAAGFVPEVVCTTDEQFAEWTGNAMNVRLVPKALPASIQLVGWSRSTVMSSYTGVLLAKVDGREVLVFMEGTRLGKRASLALQGRTDGLYQFESVVPTAFGPLRLIEVTPFDRPQLAPRIGLAD
jgi:anti-sigma factor RsiW